MTVPAPHFLLYAEAALAADCDDSASARWRFVLQSPAGETALEAADEEPESSRERLELLAVIRGLESLDQPSSVTLMTGSRYLQTGLESGLPQWRENHWQWERYGRMTPIKNADLWQRLDRLAAIHAVQCPRPSVKHCDDLTAPVAHTTKSGRKLRFDNPRSGKHESGSKHEIRNSKHETNSKHEQGNDGNAGRFRHWSFLHLYLSRASCFVLRALTLRALTLVHAFTVNLIHRSTPNSRGVSRAHHRVAGRHERLARRTPGPTAGRARAADDPPRRT